MAKTTTIGKKQNKIDLRNISERDRDILTLEVPASMKKYKLEKQPVYDRRFALNKKIKAAGLTLEDVLNTTEQKAPKKAKLKKNQTKKEATEKVQDGIEDNTSNNREVMVVNKQVPVILKPIEINFDNFSIKLNGVPKKISVNPDTNAIEIDL